MSITSPRALIKGSLEKLLSEAKSSQLKDVIKAALEKLKTEEHAQPTPPTQQESGEAGETRPSVVEEHTEEDILKFNADQFWEPFKLACDISNPSKLREVALDQLQKLIAYKLLRGALPITPPEPSSSVDDTADIAKTATSKSKPAHSNEEILQLFSLLDDSAPATTPISPIVHKLPTTPSDIHTPRYPAHPYLIDDIVHTICTSFALVPTEETVQLQVLKCLLTAVTSTSCEVHDVTLLKVIQTCFTIHLNSKNPIIQITAKAGLTQMVNLIFTRLEKYAEILTTDVSGQLSPEEIREKIDPYVNLAMDHTGITPGPSRKASLINAHRPERVESNVEVSVSSPVSEKTQSPLSPNGGFREVELGDGESAVSSPVAVESAPVVVKKEEEDSDNQTPEADVATEEPKAEEQEQEQPQQHQTVIPPKMYLPSGLSIEELLEAPVDVRITPYSPSLAYYNELLRKDVYLVFRLLCRLSISVDRPINHDSLFPPVFSPATVTAFATADTIENSLTLPSTLKSRQLALEMVLSGLNNCGKVFKSDDLFINGLIRPLLCFVIARNANVHNNQPLLFELALSVFLMTVQHYRAKLKAEIEILLSSLFLQILDTTTAPFATKSILLKALQKLCATPHLLTDIYLNYDCDLTMASVYEKLVTSCAKIAQAKRKEVPISGILSLAGYGSKEAMETAAREERMLKKEGLKCLVEIVQGLVLWSKDMFPDIPVVEVISTSANTQAGGLQRRRSDVGSGHRRTSNGGLAMVNLVGVPPAAPVDPVERSDSVLPHDASQLSANSDADEPPRSSGQQPSPLMAKHLERLKKSDTMSRSSSVGTVDSNDSEGRRDKKINIDTLRTEDKINITGQAQGTQAAPVVVSQKNPLLSLSIAASTAPQAVAPVSPDGSADNVAVSVPGAGTSIYPPVEELASRKQLFRQLLRTFNNNSAKGLKGLISNGFLLPDDVPGTVHFLRTTTDLSKSAIGELLGSGEADHIKIMHAFVDTLDFINIGFVDALRGFLQLFRLPGEAQKIDRIMEKFADRYCECNSTIFAKADTAYTLAFSIIMLNTDLHSPQIKHRMDKPAFIRNNRGINDNSDLPDEFLGTIFDDIAAHEIIMEDEHAGRRGLVALNVSSPGSKLLDKELPLRKNQHLLLKKGEKKPMTPYMPAASPELSRPMFSVACWPFMATFALLFEEELESFESESDLTRANSELDMRALDKDGNPPNPLMHSNTASSLTDLTGVSHSDSVVDYCLQGFASSIRLASIFGMETERDAFVTSLSKLTGLMTTNQLAGNELKWGATLKLRNRNIKAVKTLIALANALGEHLQSSWLQVFKVVSQMERIHSIVNRGFTEGSNANLNGSASALPAVQQNQLPPKRTSTVIDASMLTSPDKQPAAPASETLQTPSPVADASKVRKSTSFSTFGTSAASEKPIGSGLEHAKYYAALSRYSTELSSQATVVAVDRIFSNTVSFTGNGIVHFFEALCTVSAEEVGIDPNGWQHCHHALPSTSLYVTASSSSSGPRMYLLQRIVEIAYYNMYRIRFEWSQIWKVLQPYFNVAGCHPSSRVSTFAVDSLRQLSMKFLEKDELAHYHTQNEFLRSFEWIVKQNPSVAVRELTLQSLVQMIFARARNIKSGWKSIFVVLSKVANSEPNTPEGQLLARKSFEVLKQIHSDYFSAVVQAGGFVDFVNSLAEFAMTEIGHHDDEVVVQSLSLLHSCAQVLAKEKPENALRRYGSISDTTAPSSPAKPSVIPAPEKKPTLEPVSLDVRDKKLVNEDAFFLKWFPIFSSFSRVIVESQSKEVRTKAIELFFESLKMAGKLFHATYWRNIFRSVLFPIFEDLLDTEGGRRRPRNDAEVVNVWIQTVKHLTNLYSDLPELLEDPTEFMKIITAMMSRKDLQLALAGQSCLIQFLRNNWLQFMKSPENWEQVTDIVETAFNLTTAKELAVDNFENIGINDRTGSPGPKASSPTSPTVSKELDRKKLMESLANFDFDLVRTKYTVHLDLVRGILDLLLMRVVEGGNEERILEPNIPTPTTPTPQLSTVSLETVPLTPRITELELKVVEAAAREANGHRVLTPNRQPAISIIPQPFLSHWLSLIHESYLFANKFNSNYELRVAIYETGLTGGVLPTLSKQETISLSGYIRLLFALYRTFGDAFTNADGSPLVKTLVDETIGVLDRFVFYLSDSKRYERNIEWLSPVVITIYMELLAMEKFWERTRRQLRHPREEEAMKNAYNGLRKEMVAYFKLGIRIITVGERDVRAILQEFFERIAEVYLSI